MRLLAYIFVLGMIFVAACDRSQSLWFDEQGVAHGTGEKVYRYDNRTIMLREHYIDGRLELSKWFAPDGTLVEQTDWIDECGEGVYLRQDGSIKRRIPYVNGLADGFATYYDEQGNVIEIVEFHRGKRVEP